MFRRGFQLATFFGLSLAGIACTAQTTSQPVPPLPALASNAPKDKPFESTGSEAVAELEVAVAPYIKKAQQTFPEAKKRYLDGLPPKHVFYAVTKLKDNTGTSEQVFIAVSSIRDGRITGRIATDIIGVTGYKQGDVHSFSEGDLIDWLISLPNGTEEGNVVGKFLDEWQEKHRKK